MGKKSESSESRLERKKREFERKKRVEFHNKKMLEDPKHPYTKDELDIILNLLKDNIHPQDIAYELSLKFPDTLMTATQIKKIRLIMNKGDDLAKEQLMTFKENGFCKYFPSRIIINMRDRNYHETLDKRIEKRLERRISKAEKKVQETNKNRYKINAKIKRLKTILQHKKQNNKN